MCMDIPWTTDVECKTLGKSGEGILCTRAYGGLCKHAWTVQQRNSWTWTSRAIGRSFSENYAVTPRLNHVPLSNSYFPCYDPFLDTAKPQKIAWLVVSTQNIETYQSIGMIIPTRWENKKCSKPPNSCYYIHIPVYPQQIIIKYSLNPHIHPYLPFDQCDT